MHPDNRVQRGTAWIDATREPGGILEGRSPVEFAPAPALEPEPRSVEGELLDADPTESESALAFDFVRRHGNRCRYVSPWDKWLLWDGKCWTKDETHEVFDLIRQMAHCGTVGTKDARRTASASFVAGTERLARHDQRLVLLPEQLDADPWALNTQSGVVDLRTGTIRPHDPTALMTRITTAQVDADEGRELWAKFLSEVTQGDRALSDYLQRVAGYCATGVSTEDVLVFLFGVGSNGKSSWAEAIADALGDYAMAFSPEVLMASKGEKHPTELAQFMGVRMAFSSEPSSSAVWNDSRIKALTGDATISARFMRCNFFTFSRTHKTVLIGNHMPKLNAVTQAIRRRVQMVPFRAVFQGTGGGMRERLKAEAGGAILAWIIDGVAKWREHGTAPPEVVRTLTDEYLSDQDELGQWLSERVDRDANAFEASSHLYGNYKEWCEGNGIRPKSNMALSQHLVGLGFEKKKTMVGRVLHGIKLKAP